MALHPVPAQTNSRETLYAILASALIAVILASLVTGNPFHSLTQAYRDYSKEPRGNVGSPGSAAVAGPAAPATK